MEKNPLLKVVFSFYIQLIYFLKLLAVAQGVERESRRSLWYLLEMPTVGGMTALLYHVTQIAYCSLEDNL